MIPRAPPGADGQPLRPRTHWKIALHGVRLAVWTLSPLEGRPPGAILNETSPRDVVGPRLRTVLRIPGATAIDAQIDTGATHIFAPIEAVTMMGRHALASELSLLLDFSDSSGLTADPGPEDHPRVASDDDPDDRRPRQSCGPLIRTREISLNSRGCGCLPASSSSSCAWRGRDDGRKEGSSRWQDSLECLGATIAVHPRPSWASSGGPASGSSWVLGMPFLDSLEGGILFEADGLAVRL
jgi:hypothetical protein